MQHDPMVLRASSGERVCICSCAKWHSKLQPSEDHAMQAYGRHLADVFGAEEIAGAEVVDQTGT
jgi:hypothetical protein